MQVVERHIIQRNHPHYQEIDKLCFAAKNLYNYANFHIRQSFIFAQKYLDYNCLAKQLKSTEPYLALPAKVAQQVLLGLHRNWSSFFAAIKAYAEDKSKFLGRPKLPKYKHKEKGRHLLVYTAQAVSKPKMKSGLIHADVNGSLNILRKVVPTAFSLGIGGVVVPPSEELYLRYASRTLTPRRSYSRQTKDMRYLSMFFGTIDASTDEVEKTT